MYVFLFMDNKKEYKTAIIHDNKRTIMDVTRSAIAKTSDKTSIMPTTTNSRNYDVLKSEIEKYILDYNFEFGIYYEDINTKSSFGINESKEFLAASTTKLPLNYMLYKYAEEGKIDLEDKAKYLSEDYEAGAGVIQNSNVGSVYTLRELAKHSIRESDNIAKNMLFRVLGGTAFCRNYFNSIGGKVNTPERNITCAKDMGLYLKLAHEFSISNPDLGSEIITNLQNTIYNDRLPKLLSKEIKIAHKIGNYEGNIHDVGIVYTKNPFIICVLTNNSDNEEEATNFISDISKMVYDFQVK